jgi:hypothetical protein
MDSMSMMVVGRAISILSWFGCGIISFFYYRRFLGGTTALLVATFFLLPNLAGTFLEIVNVSPNGLMVFLFLAAMFLAAECLEGPRTRWQLWILAGVMGGLCFLAKQQGIVALASCGVAMILYRVKITKFLLFSVSASVVVFFSVFYLELVNNGNYLKAVFFELSRIMTWYHDLAFIRFDRFLAGNIFFTVSVLASFWFVIKKRVRPSLWQISVVMHLPLLYKTLGNGGGGPNYFLTFWFSLVACSVDFVYRSESLSVKAREWFKLLLLANTFVAMVTGYLDLNGITSPNEELRAIAKSADESIAELLKDHRDPKVLAYRNVGSVLHAGAKIDIEGSTLFSYAWEHPEVFSKSRILTSIQSRMYDFIFNGYQPFPPDVQAEIDANYVAVKGPKMPLLYGALSEYKVYKRKEN